MANTGMSSCCLSGSVHEGTPKGRVDTIGGLQTYIAEPEGGSTAKSIVFIVDSKLEAHTTQPLSCFSMTLY